MKRINFKNQALANQLSYKENTIKVSGSGTHGGKEYPHILSDEDAKTGKNFYCFNQPNEWQALQDWANKSSRRKVNFLGNGLKNMLRSEHIAYNFFYPLAQLQKEKSILLPQFINQLFTTAVPINVITDIKIEYASALHKSKLLKDNTSFDVYIEGKRNDQKVGFGIEIKYTEKSYPYGKKEHVNMFDKTFESAYLKPTVAQKSIYKKDAYKRLREKDLKQPWRNHLLGMKLLELKQLEQFYSVHIYPEKNEYQKTVCDNYKEQIKSEYQNTFIPVTFETFIAVAASVFNSSVHQQWLKYLKDRY